MRIHVYGQSKPEIRWYNKDGKYKEYRTASYSGHVVAYSMQEAVKLLQEYIKRGWDVRVEIEH